MKKKETLRTKNNYWEEEGKTLKQKEKKGKIKKCTNQDINENNIRKERKKKDGKWN